jgi:hypothetical protein
MNPLLLGQLMPGKPVPISPAWWDFLLVGGVALGLALMVFAVVAFTRRSPKHRSRSRGPEILKHTQEHLREKEAGATLDEDTEANDQHRRRKRRRRDHRPRNPSLAEAGGLPPARDPDSAPHTGL